MLHARLRLKAHTKVKGRLLLDVVIRQGPSVLQLLTGKDETLLIRRDTLLVLNLCLNIVDGVGRLDLERDCLAGQRLHKDLHTTAQTEHCNPVRIHRRTRS
jgi:hypothetical protein